MIIQLDQLLPKTYHDKFYILFKTDTFAFYFACAKKKVSHAVD